MEDAVRLKAGEKAAASLVSLRLRSGPRALTYAGWSVGATRDSPWVPHEQPTRSPQRGLAPSSSPMPPSSGTAACRVRVPRGASAPPQTWAGLVAPAEGTGLRAPGRSAAAVLRVRMKEAAS